MSADVFERVLDEMRLHRAHVRVVVMYHGGEPLLNPQLCRMIGQIKDIDQTFFVKTVSNGMALTEKCAEELLCSGLDELEVSLDGESSDESEWVREKSNTRRVLSNVRRVLALKRQRRASKPAVSIATVQFVRDKAQREVPETPLVPAWIRQAFDGEQGVQFKSCYALEWPHMGHSGKYDLVTLGGEDRDTCDHVINRMTIRADGSVVPCCHDMTSRLVMGNICEQALADIWNGANYRRLRRSIATKRYESICANCPEVRPAKYLVPKFRVAA